MEVVDDLRITQEPNNKNNLQVRGTGYSDQRISTGNQIQIFLVFWHYYSTFDNEKCADKKIWC